MGRHHETPDEYRKRLLLQERHTIKLQKEALINMVLVFPNSYEVGMSNLGFQSLYRMWNEMEGVRCERAFVNSRFPESIRALESDRALSDFDIIAFSIAFELDYINVIRALIISGLEPYAKNRHDRDPIVLIGGAATLINPIPLLPFVDVIFTGEMEPALESCYNQLLGAKQARASKIEMLEQLDQLNGFLAPAIAQSTSVHQRILWTRDNWMPQYSAVITPNTHFSNMFLIEIGRGCGRFCSFCAASHVYHPVRFFDQNKILSIIEDHAFSTRKIGLVGAALCDFHEIESLCDTLVRKEYRLGLSSFRFEALTQNFVRILEIAGIQTVTLAPEAGTEKLRWKINKRITDQTIFDAIVTLAASSIRNVKLYFLIGLPFERDDDVEGIIELVTRIRNILDRAQHHKTLTISMNAFIPKPFTLFQWAPMADAASLKKKRHKIEQALKKLKGVQFTPKGVRQELLQGIVAVGGKEISELLMEMAHNKRPSISVLNELSHAVCSERSDQMQLPWDGWDYPIPRERLWQNWTRLSNDEKT